MAEVPSVLLTSSSVTDSVTLTGEQTVGPGRPHLAGAKAVSAELLTHLLVGVE